MEKVGKIYNSLRRLFSGKAAKSKGRKKLASKILIYGGESLVVSTNNKSEIQNSQSQSRQHSIEKNSTNKEVEKHWKIG